MRPGQLLPGEGDVPGPRIRRTATIRIVNRGRFPASVSSHVPLAFLSRNLEFAREGLEGARVRLPAGASVRIEPGAEIEVEIIWT